MADSYPRESTMDLSIIIVNWNSISYLKECVASIYRQTHDLSFEIVVIDNASPNGDAQQLDSIAEGITAIKSPENLGFAGANNEGFRRSSGDYVLFLNPDTELRTPALNRMMSRIAELPDAGIVGCRLLNTDGTIQTSCIQTFPTILNQLLDAEWLRQHWPSSSLWGIAPLFSNDTHPAPVEVISGACMLARRDVLDQVGVFSEDYFMYSEDLDLCFKAMRAGYKNYYLNDVEVLHHGGKSSNPQWAAERKWQSVVMFCRKHRGKRYAQIFKSVMTLAAITRLAVIAVAGVVCKIGNRQASKTAFMKWTAVLRGLRAT